MAVAADVPSKYDVVINGQGYTFLRTLDGSYLSASRHRAEYTSTPTFVERQNISNAYGDNAQDFFLTARNRDWSLGEQQKFFRSGADGRYWMGQNVDVTTPGQVTLARSVTSITLASAAKATCRYVAADTGQAAVATTTNLYSVDSSGTITDQGAHGLGSAPSRYAMCTDLTNIYMSSTGGGSVGVRNFAGGVFSTFSATAADSLAFLNNTLYGFVGSKLQSYDTAGTATVLFTWKDGHGAAAAVEIPKMVPFGGKLLLAFPYAQESSELWIYDGSGVSRLEVFPENFVINDIEVLYGVAYISGSFVRGIQGGVNTLRPAVLFFDGSEIGKLWQASSYSSTSILDANRIPGPHPSLGVLEGRLVFPDETTGNVMAYDPAVGGISSIGTFTPTTAAYNLMASALRMVLYVRNQTTAYFFPDGSYPSSGYVASSLIDFESSLSKQFRGIKVDFSAATDGNGGSVDIAYQVDSLDGSWTTLQTAAVSGTEYTFSSVSGHAVAVKVTLNKGTSTAGPTLKSLNVRAAPVLTSFKVRTYHLDLSSTRDHPTQLQDGTDQTLTGFEQAVNLQTAISATSPLSITDKFGTYTGVCEPSQCSILELHSDGGSPTTPGQYTAQITVRQV